MGSIPTPSTFAYVLLRLAAGPGRPGPPRDRLAPIGFQVHTRATLPHPSKSEAHVRLTNQRFSRSARVCFPLIIVFTACSSGTEPAPSTQQLDAAALAARFGPVAEALQAPPLQSLRDLAIPMYLSGIEMHALAVHFPGRTLEWNQETTRYVESNRAGAPEDGLRAILYAIDAVSGLPALPLSEVGALDLFVLSRPDRPDSSALRFVVRGPGPGGVIYADFTAKTVDFISESAIIAGYVTSGATRLDFAIPYHIVFQGPVYFGGLGHPSGTFEAAPQNLRFVNDVTLLEDRGNFFDFAAQFVVDARMAVSNDSLALSGTLTIPDDGALHETLTLKVNGSEFGTLESTGSIETFRASNGQALGLEGQNVLRVLAETLFSIGLNIEFPTLVIFYCGC